MRKLIAWAGAWIFYYSGCFFCWVLELNGNNERWASFWYSLYNHDMLTSSDLQTWANGHGRFWPWGEPE
jgi:hypothetical protein